MASDVVTGDDPKSGDIAQPAIVDAAEPDSADVSSARQRADAMIRLPAGLRGAGRGGRHEVGRRQRPAAVRPPAGAIRVGRGEDDFSVVADGR